MRKRHLRLTIFVACIFVSSLAANVASAQQPFGWINNGHVSAFTLAPGEFELTGHMLRVNDTIDFMNFRDDLLATTTRLTGNSGDLKGWRGELRIGVLPGLDVFYRHQSQDMTLKLNVPARVNIVDLDSALETDSKTWGLKWMFYQSELQDRSQSWRSAAIEVSRHTNKSQNFGGLIEQINFDASTIIQLDPPGRFDLDRLGDKGWQSRIIVSQPLSARSSAAFWLGYADLEGSSGTSTGLPEDFFQEAFFQTFDTSEKQWLAGASLNWQPHHRVPVQIGYEFRRLYDRRQQNISASSELIPAFLRGDNVADGANNNHTLYANAAWWVTPQVYVSAGGKLFRNQFVGLMPHFNNPLSGSFSEVLYGYAEVSIGIRFTPASFRPN